MNIFLRLISVAKWLDRRRIAVIRKCKKKDRQSGKSWCLYSKDGTRLLGRHKTKEDALSQERAVQFFKHRG